MHTNPSQVQQVYMGCDALYWITDGDCQKQSFEAFQQKLQPRHMIVSEFWIQRDMIPLDFVTMDAGVLDLIRSSVLSKVSVFRCVPHCVLEPFNAFRTVFSFHNWML